MKRASKRMGRRLYQAGILEIYLLLYVFVKLQVFPPTSSQPSFTIFLLSSPSLHPLLHLFLSLPLRASRHLDRCICASLCWFLRRTCAWKSPKMLTSTRLHQISHVAEHLLNLLTLRASRWKVGEDLTAIPAN